MLLPRFFALPASKATRYYSLLASQHNLIPLVTPVQPDLNQYAIGKAVDGLFTLIAQEEANIRETRWLALPSC